MRVFLTVLILIFSFQSWTKADDIRDFEIEGMSIGDSLLDYYSKKEIKNGTKNFYTGSKDFFELSFLSPKSDSYTQITFTLKRDDKNYIINAIAGIIFPYEIKSCNIKKAEIIDELNSVFENARKKNYDYTYTKLADGKSVAEITDFILDDGSAVRVYCTDWSKATEEMKSTNYNDMLSVDITSKLIMDWLRNEAY